MAEVELFHANALRMLFYAVLKEYTVANIEMLEALGSPKGMSQNYMDLVVHNTHTWGDQFNNSLRLLKESIDQNKKASDEGSTETQNTEVRDDKE